MVKDQFACVESLVFKHTKDLKKFKPIALGDLHALPPGPGFPHGGVFINLKLTRFNNKEKLDIKWIIKIEIAGK